MSNVFGIRLVNGENIIGKIENTANGAGEGSAFKKNSSIKIINPTVIAIAHDQGKPNMGLVDYLPFSDKKQIVIDETHILFMYELKNEILNAYNVMFGSGLIIPPTKANIFPFTKK